MAKKKAPQRRSRTQTKKETSLTNAREMSVLMQTLSRSGLSAGLGMSYGSSRDLYAVLGYPKSLTFKHYFDRYCRQDIAKAIINKPVRKTWSKEPKITEAGETKNTLFEVGWSDLLTRIRMYHYFSRVDRLASLGKYAVLFLGFDKPNFAEPVERAGELLYVMPYSEEAASIERYVDDKEDARFGQPEMYKVKMTGASGTAQNELVHYTRVIHVAQDTLDSDVEGTPVLECVFNRLMDVELTAGGSAEMLWRGAQPGLGLLARDGAEFGDSDADMNDSIEEYIHGLKRYIKLQNVDIQQLAPQVADPSNHMSIQLDLISAATGIPRRILLGSERGELASSQDEKNWTQHVDERRQDYAEHVILRPTVNRLIDVGVLKEPGQDGYSVDWPDLSVTSDKEKADTAVQFATALAKYSDSLDAQNFVPFPVFAEHVLNWTPEQLLQLDAQVAEEQLVADVPEEPAE